MDEQTIVDQDTNETVENDNTPKGVNVSSMSNEDLKAVIQKQTQEKEEPEEPGTEEPVKETTEEKKEAEPPKEPVKEPSKEETVSKEEHEKLQKRLKDQEAYLARLGTELGLLRKKNPAEYNQRLQEIRDKFFDDPVTATAELKALDQEKERHDELEKQYQVQTVLGEFRKVIADYAPDFESNIGEIAKILISEDNEDPAWVTEFQRNPYMVKGVPMDPGMLFQMNKRLVLSKENAALKEEIGKMKKENEQLRKKPGKILSQIEHVSKQTLPSGSPGPGKTGSVHKPVSQMTKEELKQNQRIG